MNYLAAEVLPGRGTVSRRGRVALWLGTDVPEPLATQILQVARAAHDDYATSAVDEVGSLVSSEPPSSVGSLVVVAVSSPSVKAILHGRAVVQNGRGEAHSGAFTSQVLRFELPMDGLVGIWGLGDWSEVPTSVPHDLRDGTVPGGGLVIREETVLEASPADAVPPGRAAQPAPPSAPVVSSPTAELVSALVEPGPAGPDPAELGPAQVQTPAAGNSLQLLDLAAPAPTRPPLPIASEEPTGPIAESEPAHPGLTVQGVMCVNGHFNHPDMLYCRVCGISMIQLTKILVDGPRPALGVVVGSDGSTYIVDADYVVGREPDPGEGRAIVVKDERVSRRHARLSTSGWDLVVTDLDSSNGTYVKNPGWHDWVRAVGGHPMVVEPRGQIGMGSQILVFESSVRPSKL